MFILGLATQLAVVGCPAAESLRPPVLCEATAAALVVSADSMARRLMLSTLVDAGSRFEATWGARASRGAIVDGPGVDSALAAALRRGGSAWILPWPLRRVARDPAGSEDLTRATSALAHEVGHVLFARHVWPAGGRGGLAQRTYGSAAPDWLDEVAAASLEFDDRLAADSLARLHTTIIPFSTFLTMSHPAMARDSLMAAIQAEVARRRASGESLSTMQLSVGASQAADLTTYYRQVRLFTQFVSHSACGRAAWASLAASLARQADVPWPSEAAVRLCLPPDVTSLGERFERWVAERGARQDR